MATLPSSVRQSCEEILDARIDEFEPISGGDISPVFRIRTADKESYFLKTASFASASEMFKTEEKGLELLRKASSLIETPKVIACGQADSHAFLLMHFIPTHGGTITFWEKFGKGLAEIHKNKEDKFGLNHHNFIGKLPQSNNLHDDWPTFYKEERILPQVTMAISNGKLSEGVLKKLESLFEHAAREFPDEPPALIHGDLWMGNYMDGPNEQPYLIDPAVSYSHREMDLAMSMLFGGFDRVFYSSYEEHYPLAPGLSERLHLYQLYYLLVHLNLFGGAYKRSVMAIIDKY